MKTEDLFSFIEYLISRDDGHTEALENAKNLNQRGKPDEAKAILLKLPKAVLSGGRMKAHPEKRNELVPDESFIPDFLKTKPAPKAPAAEEKKK